MLVVSFEREFADDESLVELLRLLQHIKMLD